MMPIEDTLWPETPADWQPLLVALRDMAALLAPRIPDGMFVPDAIKYLNDVVDGRNPDDESVDSFIRNGLRLSAQSHNVTPLDALGQCLMIGMSLRSTGGCADAERELFKGEMSLFTVGLCSCGIEPCDALKDWCKKYGIVVYSLAAKATAILKANTPDTHS